MGQTIASDSAPREPLRIRCVTSIADVPAADWDALDHGPSPFLRHGFLRALELSESIGSGTGWHPFYVLAETGFEDAAEPASVVGATAAFVKSHSYGEYIFDWAWAGASERAGIPYYPKLVIAAPVTPATGRRFLIAPCADREMITAALLAGVRQIADEAECSSIHVLFSTRDEHDLLTELGLIPRMTYQFHWHNRDYADYDAFLAQLTSRKRKQLRKERARAREHIDEVRFVSGGELSPRQLDAMDRYYRNTVWAHGGMDYLQSGFFHQLAKHLPDNMLFAEAMRGDRTMAGALYLETDAGLYGRYWGCDEEIELLHFEVAYYAGIERCIARGTPLFEAGAQGEHKLLRGFLPSPTYSSHWLRHPGLSEAIAGFAAQEQREMRARMERLAACGPYRCEE